MKLFQLLLALLGLWNVMVFVSYGIDKQRAKKGEWRLSERLLLLEALALGGIGAFLAGHFFHHKIRKWRFNLTWILGLIIDALILYLILTYLS